MRPVRTLPVLLFVATVLGALPSARAGGAADATERSAADAGIARQLDELGYRYEVDEDGDYRLAFDLDGGRSQLAFVISAVEEFGSLRVREVWAPAYRAQGGAFPAEVANRLLEDSHTGKLGGWVKQGDTAVLVVKLAADASAQQLDDALDYVLRAADQMEAELTGQDEF
ncbi:YbjN domain-containing protein [Vulcaniibacterium tengchongense]|uniref:Putative sensory transduction regulator n=1 Tax=Vulcaniibacterium tengchongense TaxID=1273429 RepID=A0A3N4VG15_9GAMM|nr:YbjN domain-containing protein [Vulcaniibacterium tengchongense]RPE81638.1 putative sensory transduction regulator [Vulcaniibacterium tengchongense]